MEMIDPTKLSFEELELCEKELFERKWLKYKEVIDEQKYLLKKKLGQYYK
jgi:hypothetical protein